ncbi:MAG: MotA/TolQ/ExbB proton channel family protein [Oligoflexia bacterium]|nr:MotA/TolQ/ExbB proton channel family protein [Oligoflexia bacterium]
MQPTPETGNFIIEAFRGGGWGMYPIAIIFVLTIYLIIERYIALRSLSVDKEDFNEKIFGMVLRGDIRQAITFCDSRPAPLTNTLKAGLVQVVNRRPDEEVQVAMDGAALKEMPRLDGWTSYLAVFANVATLLGLLGTIAGLITSFRAVTFADPAQKATLLSAGISEAMNCTAFGLIVAIPALMAYGYYQTRIQRLVNDMNESSVNVMNLIVSNRDKIKD